VRRETFEAPEPLDLRLRLVEGAIEIETHELPEAIVELEGLNDRGERVAQEARVELQGRALTVEVDRKVSRISIGRGPGVRATVRLPHGSAIDVGTVSADMNAQGRYAAAAVKSVSGDVRVASVDGNVEVKSVSGGVSTGHAGGRFEAKTVSGDVSAGEVGKGARVKTISGDTAIGSVAEGDVRLQSVSGGIRLGIAPGAGVWMDVKSVSGKTESDLAVGDDPPVGEARRLEVRANSVSGDIRITRGSGVAS
jgi:hypothetical protein